jgi:uncharacterized repeat protein (TIGR01451 family)
MNRWILGLLAAGGSLSIACASPSLECLTDSSQADFQNGTATNVDLASSPGDALLSAQAAILDQQNTNVAVFSVDFHTTKWIAQTFKPGVSGRLAQVDVDLFCDSCTGTTPDLTISIQSLNTGNPSGIDLATATIPGFSSQTPTYYSAVFATPPQLSAGVSYAIVVRANAVPSAGKYDVPMAFFTNPYANGFAMRSSNSGGSWEQLDADSGFKTYMLSTFVASGTLESNGKDGDPTATGSTSWMTLSWDAATPANTSLVFQIAASNGGPFDFVGPDNTAATYFTTSGASLLQFSGNRFLRYRAYLATSNNTVTPVLQAATVCVYHGTATDVTISNDDGVTAPAAGSSIVYAINVANIGDGGATGVAVEDAFPPGLSCTWTCDDAGGGSCAASGIGDIDESVDLPAGTSVEFGATCSIPADSTATLTNTATASFEGDTDPSNNSATDIDNPVIESDVGVTLSDGRGNAQLGDVLDYQIVVSNNGPSAAVAAVSDVLPSQLTGGIWTCTPDGGAACNAGSGDTLSDNATLPPGATATYQYSAMVQAEGDGIIVDMASANVTIGTDPAPLNDSTTDTDTVVIFVDGFD